MSSSYSMWLNVICFRLLVSFFFVCISLMHAGEDVVYVVGLRVWHVRCAFYYPAFILVFVYSPSFLSIIFTLNFLPPNIPPQIFFYWCAFLPSFSTSHFKLSSFNGIKPQHCQFCVTVVEIKTYKIALGNVGPAGYNI